MKKILVNKKYESLRNYLESIPERMLQEGTTLYDHRNLIKELIAPNGLHINVKRYHKPFFLNNLIYSSGIRKPKGQRAYQYPFILAEKGIDTPESIAYIEERKCGLLQFSYFISVQVPSRLFYDLGSAEDGTYEDLALAFAAFTAHMHKQEVLHKDYSPGNILYNKEENGTYRFSIVDINRMKFGPVDMATGCANFARLWGPKRFIIMVVREYARLRGFNPDACEKLALQARKRFWQIYQRKHSVDFNLEL